MSDPAACNGPGGHVWHPKFIGRFRGEPVYVEACQYCGIRHRTYDAIVKERGDA